MRDYRQLEFWEKSHKLTLNIYKITNEFPKHELYGLTSQIRRASASIPTNIAEGCGRDSKKELNRFLIISSGSASEVEYQLLLAKDLNYISIENYQILADELVIIRKTMNNYIQRIKGSI